MRNSAAASLRIDISVIGVSAPLRRNTRNVKISISDSRGAQPVTVKRRADALNEHAASVIPDGTFWNFNEDWLPPSLRRFFHPRCFLGHRSQITSELWNWLLWSECVFCVERNAWWNYFIDKDASTCFRSNISQERAYYIVHIYISDSYKELYWIVYFKSVRDIY